MKIAFVGLEGIISNDSDTLIEGADEDLRTILKRWKPYHCFVLTNRPESMRETTFDWLIYAFYASSQYLPDPFWSRNNILMRPATFQGLSTAEWKAGIIQTITIMDNVDNVLIIDEEATRLKELMENTEWTPFKLQAYSSLRQARFEHGKSGAK